MQNVMSREERFMAELRKVLHRTLRDQGSSLRDDSDLTEGRTLQEVSYHVALSKADNATW